MVGLFRKDVLQDGLKDGLGLVGLFAATAGRLQANALHGTIHPCCHPLGSLFTLDVDVQS